MQSKKNARIHLRCSEAEKALLQQNAKIARMSCTQYILALNEHKKIFIVEGIPELIVELTRIGTNINQIARYVNTTKSVTSNELKTIDNHLNLCQEIMIKIINQIYDIEEKETI